MFKQTLVATVAVYILWSIIDFLVHGILLQSAYQETLHPMAFRGPDARAVNVWGNIIFWFFCGACLRLFWCSQIGTNWP